MATVPVFDIETTLLKMLNIPKLMKLENIASNYDIFTGRSTTSLSKLNEIHTGNAWESAHEFYCGDDSHALALGLVLFYDKTHTNLFGSLATAPLLAVLTLLNESCRSNEKVHGVPLKAKICN